MMSGAFPPYQLGRKRAAEQTARTVEKGHGRLEVRTLVSTTLLNGYLDWPSVGQVFELRRSRRFADGRVEEEVVWGVTSLSRERADAARLLGLVRGHWGIENSLHHVRDETLGEDRCRVRTGEAPRVLAAVRNVAVYLLGEVDAPSKAAACRRLCVHPEEGLALIS